VSSASISAVSDTGIHLVKKKICHQQQGLLFLLLVFNGITWQLTYFYVYFLLHCLSNTFPSLSFSAEDQRHLQQKLLSREKIKQNTVTGAQKISVETNDISVI